MRAVERWVALHLEPELFFDRLRDSAWDRRAWVAILLVGVENMISRVDMSTTFAAFGEAPATPSPALDSWPAFWVGALVAAPVAGALRWYVGGFWTGLRARWCGAHDPDFRLARLICLYSDLVAAAPAILLAIAASVMFPSYRIADASDTASGTLALMGTLAWSVYVSYRGASTAFGLERWRARFWFLALPALFFVGAGLAAAFYRTLP